MENRISQKYAFRIFVLVFWVVATLAGLINYQGSLLVFFVFSLVFYILVVDTLRRPVVSAVISSSLSYGFLVAFLTLGFWAKLVLHLVVVYDYREPIGYFDGSPQAWDQVLLVTSTGVAGLLAARYFLLIAFRLFSPPSDYTVPNVATFMVALST